MNGPEVDDRAYGSVPEHELVNTSQTPLPRDDGLRAASNSRSPAHSGMKRRRPRKSRGRRGEFDDEEDDDDDDRSNSGYESEFSTRIDEKETNGDLRRQYASAMWGGGGRDGERADAQEEDRRQRQQADAARKAQTDAATLARAAAEEDELESVRAQLAGLSVTEYREGFAISHQMGAIIQEAMSLTDLYKQQERDDHREIMGMTWEENISSKSEKQKEVCTGDLRIREFMYLVSNAKMDRYAPQMEVVRAALSSLVRQMFGKDYLTHEKRLATQYGITDTRSQLLVIMARRNGKTQIASVIEAACQVVMQGYTAIFAAVMPQANDLMQLVHTRVMEFTAGRKDPTIINNQKKVEYDFSETKDKKKPRAVVRCFSGSKISARGFKADRIYFDEASYATANFIKVTVFPGMMLLHVFIFMFSSPPEDTNHIFARMFTSVSSTTGEPHFKSLQLDNMCHDCRSKKYMKCPHVKPARASWLAADAEMGVIEEVMKNIDERAYRQEILGQMGDDDLSMFSNTNVDDFEGLPRVRFNEPVRQVLIGVDTSGGGQSETAICAMALDGSKNHVVRLYPPSLSLYVFCTISSRGRAGGNKNIRDRR